METPPTDSSHDLTSATRIFEQLSRRLTDVAEQIRISGGLPPDDLVGEVVASLRSYTELRDKAMELIGLLQESSVQPPQDTGSMKDVGSLLEMVTEARRKKVQEEKACARALTTLDSILSLIHREQQEFYPLGEVQSKARGLQEAIRAFEGPDVHPDVHALAQGRHPLAEFLTLAEGHDKLDDDLWLLLKHAVEEHFGKSLAFSAARGKLGLSPTRSATDRSPDEPRSNRRPTAVQAAFTEGESSAPDR